MRHFGIWRPSTYKGMEIEKGDTVVLSARIIPGNEKNISRLIGHLYKRGANIIEEKRRLDTRFRTRFARRYQDHGRDRQSRSLSFLSMANTACFSARRSLLRITFPVMRTKTSSLSKMERCSSSTDHSASIVEKHEMHKTFIDEESMEEIEYDIVRERKKLAYGGAISLVVQMDRSNTMVGAPQITFQGVAGR